MNDIEFALSSCRVWAVVGCSPDPLRDSHRIASLLIDRGYDVIPVNPRETELLGRPCYPDVAAAVAAGHVVEVVDIFRRSDQAGVHVDEAVGAGAKVAWMQLGVIDAAAAERGRAAGLRVVMDRCPAIELARNPGYALAAG